ncbi:hypothetical protein JCM10207_004898 [Rhodosporidiobolus poonsookiae]
MPAPTGHSGPLAIPAVEFRTLDPQEPWATPPSLDNPQLASYGFNRHGETWHGYNEANDEHDGGRYHRWLQPMETELAKQVEYDMDDQDQLWLDALNADRKKESHAPISYELFEVIMDKIEKEWFDLTKHIPRRSAAVPTEDAKCAICDDGECENSNAIVFCDGCNLAVHQDCYGVPYIPEGQWLCRKCTVSPEKPVTCVLCPNPYGAFKQTTSGQWAHVLCAIWIPDTGVSNTVYMEPIDGVEGISKSRWKLICYLCKKRVGACIQCANRSCYTAFHPTCAREYGLELRMKTAQGGPAGELKAWCDKHGERPAPAALTRALTQAKQRGGSAAQYLKLTKKKTFKTARGYSSSSAGPPVVPAMIADRVLAYVAKVKMPGKKEVVNVVARYWSLKREARRGAPLLKRIHLEPWTASATSRQASESDRAAKLALLRLLRNDLEKVRMLTEQVRKREKKKLERAVLVRDAVLEMVFPLGRRLGEALREIKSLDRQQFFARPVNPADVPDYHDIIKHPMDWQTMQDKLDRFEYASAADFQGDFHLVINNARRYNKPASPLHKSAVSLLQRCTPIIDALDALDDVAQAPPLVALAGSARLREVMDEETVAGVFEVGYDTADPEGKKAAQREAEEEEARRETEEAARVEEEKAEEETKGKGKKDRKGKGKARAPPPEAEVEDEAAAGDAMDVDDEPSAAADAPVASTSTSKSKAKAKAKEPAPPPTKAGKKRTAADAGLDAPATPAPAAGRATRSAATPAPTPASAAGASAKSNTRAARKEQGEAVDGTPKAEAEEDADDPPKPRPKKAKGASRLRVTAAVEASPELGEPLGGSGGREKDAPAPAAKKRAATPAKGKKGAAPAPAAVAKTPAPAAKGAKDVNLEDVGNRQLFTHFETGWILPEGHSRRRSSVLPPPALSTPKPSAPTSTSTAKAAEPGPTKAASASARRTPQTTTVALPATLSAAAKPKPSVKKGKAVEPVVEEEAPTATAAEAKAEETRMEVDEPAAVEEDEKLEKPTPATKKKVVGAGAGAAGGRAESQSPVKKAAGEAQVMSTTQWEKRFRELGAGVMITEKTELDDGYLVWARLPGYPWYPAEVVDPSDPETPDVFRSDKQPGKVPVYFFSAGDEPRTAAWLQHISLRELGENDEFDQLLFDPAHIKFVKKNKVNGSAVKVQLEKLKDAYDQAKSRMETEEDILEREQGESSKPKGSVKKGQPKGKGKKVAASKKRR